jgi:hypothetical protein
LVQYTIYSIVNNSFISKNEFTQVKKYGPVPAGKHGKSMEHGNSISTESLRIFSGEFWSFPGEG